MRSQHNRNCRLYQNLGSWTSSHSLRISRSLSQIHQSRSLSLHFIFYFLLYVDIQFYFSIPKSSSQSTSHVTPSIPPVFHWILSLSIAFSRIHIASLNSPRTLSDSSRFHLILPRNTITYHPQSKTPNSHIHGILATPSIIITMTV